MRSYSISCKFVDVQTVFVAKISDVGNLLRLSVSGVLWDE